MFQTFGNKKGIIDLVTKNWDKNPQVHRDEFQPSEQNQPISEADAFLNYRPQVDDDAEIYIPLSER